jgi:hypothetical protein
MRLQPIVALLSLTISSMIVAAILSSPLRASERDDLRATPGLWKITYRTSVSGQPDPTTFKWKCISEEQMDDPSTAFALPQALHAVCKRTFYTQTSKKISWRYTCSSDTATLHSQGSIAFDTPLHYIGKIKLEGVAMGYPIENVLAVEGVHRAACTSPED